MSAPRFKMSATASDRSQFSFEMAAGREKEEHTGVTIEDIKKDL